MRNKNEDCSGTNLLHFDLFLIQGKAIYRLDPQVAAELKGMQAFLTRINEMFLLALADFPCTFHNRSHGIRCTK